MVIDRSSNRVLRSTIPARIDRLPWSPFHTRMVLALGACWILDGFEIAVASNIGAQLAEPENLALTPTAIGLLATVYLLGEVVGALWFGRLSDRLGRRRLFLATLATYFTGSALTAAVVGHGALPLALLYLTRFVAGMGIGGEYAAVNSTVDELVPARYRGRIDIGINGTYWAGAALAGAVQVPLLSGALDPRWDWRIALLVGPVLACGIWLLRRNLPESPRWLIIQGRSDEAEASVARIENAVDPAGRTLSPVEESHALAIRPVPPVGYLGMLRLLFRAYPRSCALGATMMITQSFLYNAIFFSYASVLVHYYGVNDNQTAIYLVPFAVGNLLGPLVLGRLFDTLGRRKMISRTYGLSGALLIVSALVFADGGFTAVSQTVAWCVIFFFASAGASSAYLTVSEIFPMEVRAKAIAIFFAIAQAAGALAPLIYGALINTGNPDRTSLCIGFLAGAALMIAGAVVARLIAVDAENKSLEDIATPLSVIAAEGYPK
jgi:MFS family permease